MITILDSGICNVRSVEKAIQRVGGEVRVAFDLDSTDKLILPGVGAFAAAMRKLAPLIDDIRRFAASGRPLMGICLGQQLLLDSSEEMGETAGLGLIPGRVRYLPKDKGLKVPHMGWSPLHLRQASGPATHVVEDEQVYFVHSLYTDCLEPSDVVATTDYGVQFPSIVQRGNIWGTQFHPEKSGEVGMRVLRSFVEC